MSLRSRWRKHTPRSVPPTAPWVPAEQDVTRGRSAGTADNPLHDPTRGRSAGSADNPARDPTRGLTGTSAQSPEHDPTRSQPAQQ